MRWPAWLYRVVPYLGRRAAERDVDEELRLHLELERGVATDDLLTFAAAPLVLAAVALAACWLPARRATRVDPMEVLRFE